MVRQVGKIFIMPGERAGFAGYRGTATIVVPATGQVYSRGARRFVSRRERELEQHRIKVEKGRAQAEANARAKALADLERARLGAQRLEAQRRAIAKRNLDQALTKARQMKSLSAQAKARKMFQQSQKIARRSREETERKEMRVFEKSIVQVRKAPRAIPKKRIEEVKTPVNIFSRKSWRELGEALRKSKSKKDRSLGKKILTEPLLFASQFVRRTLEVEDLPAGVLALIKNPKNIKHVPAAVVEDLKGTVQLLKTSPSEGIAKIGADIFTFRIIGRVLKVTGKVVSPVATKLSPKFVGVAKTGTKLTVKGVGKSRVTKIRVIGKIPKEPLRVQIRRAGERVTAVSTQADSLVRLIRRKKIIRKPIPKEAKLPAQTKALLKKFDKGIIKPNELIRLDNQIKKAGAKGILETSFFADPKMRVRLSRLGIKEVKEAKLKDLLSGEATLKKSKPQILLFEDIQIQKLPKSLNSIKKKIASNKALTEIETAKLLQWQQGKTGKFKPIGFVTRESEITLAPGEVIKRVKKVGVTLVDGKKVPIISTKVIKPSKSLSELLKKAQIGKASVKELKKLSKGLKKETGFKYSTSSLKNVKNYYPLGRKLSALGIKPISKVKPSKKIPRKRLVSKIPKKIKYTESGKPYIITRYGARFISAPSRPPVSPPKKLLKAPPSKPVVSPRKRPKAPPSKAPKKIVRFAKPKRKPKKKPPIQSFNVYGKSGKKFLKLNVKPLTKDDAFSRGSFAVDHTTSRQFKIVPVGKVKKTGTLRKGERNYFKRAGYKFREHKIKKGRKFLIKPRYIEKTKHSIDTRGEKKGLSLAKFLKQQRRGKAPAKRTTIRVKRKSNKGKASPAQLAALKKGRAARMKNLRRG